MIHIRENAKVFGLLICILALFAVIRYTAPANGVETVLSDGDNYPVKVGLATTSSTYKKSQFVTIQATATNNAEYRLGIPWGTCADLTEVYLDGRHKIQPLFDGVCGIGWPSLKPGQSMTRKDFVLNLSHLESGRHTIEIRVPYEDGHGIKKVRSNEVEFNLTVADPIYNCFEYNDDITTLCQQIAVSATKDESPHQNNELCEDIRHYLGKYSPSFTFIEKLTTYECNDGKQAIFVFNVPRDHDATYLDICNRHKPLVKKCQSNIYSRRLVQ